MRRRTFLALLNGVALAAAPAMRAASAEADVPLGGNPQGDLTAVAFFDYNCPYCKRAEPELQRFVAKDGRVRLVYRDWPILGEESVEAARLALAARAQDRYEAAHGALMRLTGRRGVRTALSAAGIDMVRLDADARAQSAAIERLLRRNAREANELGLDAVPVILVGTREVRGGIDVENLEDFARRARRRRS